uniref:Uncharacterized protein n=1 Tax=Lotus japonicus TaxID=34305 RepID=I3RZA2_LOTJA|nr:unknown [Lotus japonicus]
MLTIQVKS